MSLTTFFALQTARLTTATTTHSPGKRKPDLDEREWWSRRGTDNNMTKPELLNLDDVLSLPNPDWLIADFLTVAPEEIGQATVAMLHGASKSGKSFIAIDWAMCVATGVKWLGEYPVMKGAVLYIAAEGGGGIKRRVSAWLKTHAVDGRFKENIAFSLKRINFYDEEAQAALFEALEDMYPSEDVEHPETGEQLHLELPLRLVVIDTLARHFNGGDENNNAEMNDFINKVSDFAAQKNALVLLVHHDTKSGSSERGASSLKAAVETGVKVTGQGNGTGLGRVGVEVIKQKDGDEPALVLDVINVPLPELGPNWRGEEQHSAALVFARMGRLDDDVEEPVEEKPYEHNDADLVLSFVRESGPVTQREIAEGTGVKKSPAGRILKTLEEEGKVMQTAEGYVAPRRKLGQK